MPAKSEIEQRPTGWEKLSREGSRQGAEAGWDPAKHLHYHVLENGEIVYHARPEATRLHVEKSGVRVFLPEGAEPIPGGGGYWTPPVPDPLREAAAADAADDSAPATHAAPENPDAPRT